MHAVFTEHDGSGRYRPTTRNIYIDSATTTPLVPASEKQVTRAVERLSIRNNGESDVQATLQHTDGTTTVVLAELDLAGATVVVGGQ